ncbi:MAG TPA: hypothetical protein VNB90_00265 [Cytophagaceae bacterium]|nr:hypothetical protein [Cytophagaceae bacterium]
MFAQCRDSSLVKAWGKWNELQYNSQVYRLEHRVSDSILPANIRKIVQEALVARVGEKFYSQIHLKDLSITIPLQAKQRSEDMTADGIIKKGLIKYYYSFYFFEVPNVEYRFNIALDVQGTILSEWTLPKLKGTEFINFVPFCEATNIAYNDKKAEVKKINDFILQYDPKLNYFAWKATIGYKYHEHDTHFRSYRLTINVFTGEIIDRWDAEVIKYDAPTHK